MSLIIIKDFECDYIKEHTLYPDGQRSLQLNQNGNELKLKFLDDEY